MVIKTYSVSLDSKLVDESMKIIKNYGGKLSPILNEQLSIWLNNEKRNLLKK